MSEKNIVVDAPAVQAVITELEAEKARRIAELERQFEGECERQRVLWQRYIEAVQAEKDKLHPRMQGSLSGLQIKMLWQAYQRDGGLSEERLS